VLAHTMYNVLVQVALFYEDGHPVEAKGAGKILERVQEIYASEFNGKDLAYDRDKTLYTMGSLPQKKLEFIIALGFVHFIKKKSTTSFCMIICLVKNFIRKTQ